MSASIEWFVMSDSLRTISIGATFCHVRSISLINQFRLVITIGNHQWHGVIPNFIINLIIIIIMIWFSFSITSFESI